MPLSNVLDVAQPIVDESKFRAIEYGSNAATSVVPCYDYMPDSKRIDSVCRIQARQFRSV